MKHREFENSDGQLTGTVTVFNLVKDELPSIHWMDVSPKMSGNTALCPRASGLNIPQMGDALGCPQSRQT